MTPDIDDSLDEQGAKTRFWSAFKTLGTWWPSSRRTRNGTSGRPRALLAALCAWDALANELPAVGDRWTSRSSRSS